MKWLLFAISAVTVLDQAVTVCTFIMRLEPLLIGILWQVYGPPYGIAW